MHSDDPGVSAGLMADAKADDDALVLTATQAETRVELEASRRQSDASHAPRQLRGFAQAITVLASSCAWLAFVVLRVVNVLVRCCHPCACPAAAPSVRATALVAPGTMA